MASGLRSSASSSQQGSSSRSEQMLAARLLDPNTDLNVKLKLVTDLRDSIDALTKETTGPFVEHILPAAIQYLKSNPVSLYPHTPEHKIRFTLVDCLHRMPLADNVKPVLEEAHDSMVQLLKDDSEEVSLLSIKVLLDLYRNFKEVLQPHVEDCLEAIRNCFSNMPSVVEDIFEDSSAEEGASPGQQSSSAHPLPTGGRSFKVLAECPILIVFLYQTYRDIVTHQTSLFVPIIFEFLGLQVSAQKKAHEEAAARGEDFTEVCAALEPKRAQFSELLLAQVKAISFFAYVFRVAAPAFAPYKAVIPEIVVRMLKDFPCESTSNRKELLVALRHVLATDFRTAFIPYTDTLLNERILMGSGVTAYENLRQIAYGMIADYVHHIRQELTTEQLSRVIHSHSCHMHDPTLPFTIHSMCSKLLLNLVGSVLNKESVDHSLFLNRILHVSVRKVESLAIVRTEWDRWSRPKEEWDTPEGRARVCTIEERHPLDDVDIERQRPLGPVVAMAESELESLKDVKALFKNLLITVRSILATLKHVRGEMPDATVIGRLFVAGIRCFSMIELGNKPSKDTKAEFKEIYDAFSDLFTQVDLLTFNAMWEMKVYFSTDYADVGSDLEAKHLLEIFLIEVLRGNGEINVIPQALLSNKEYSHAFTGILLRFLVTRLPDLGSCGKDESAAIIRLFKMSFMSISVFPDANEAVLLPHLNEIIMGCLRYSSEAPEPMPYYLLMRALFRAIGGGRFEALYKAVLPLLQVVLEHLNALLTTSDKVKRDLFVELCLTVPVRLSVLLPYLSYLMKPLVLALESTSDLVAQGLRTLELCVDNLTSEFLNPLMAPVIEDVMLALWRLLKPVPTGNPHFSHQTLRILGKLGGRNRKFTDHPKLSWRSLEEQAFIALSFEGKEQRIKMAPLVDLALRTIRRGDLHYRGVCFAFLKSAAASFIAQAPSTLSQEETFSQVVRGLLEAVKAPELADQARAYIYGFTSYIFETDLGQDVPDGGFAKHILLRSSVVMDALTENLASASNDSLEDLNRAGEQMLMIFQTLLASENLAKDRAFPVLRQFASRLSTLCYDHPWHRKIGGAVGLHIMVTRLGLGPSTSWLAGHELEMVRALLFLVKDAPSDPPPIIHRATDTLLYICRHTSVVSEGEPIPPQASFLVGLLVIELSSQVTLVRQTAKQCVEIIAERRAVSIAELLTPVRDRLLGPIFAKPLRALAFAMQIGHIDAVTYCISLTPPLLEFESKPGDSSSANGDHAAQDSASTPQNTADSPAGQTPTGQALNSSQNLPSTTTPGQNQMLTVEGMLGRLLIEALGIADAEDVALANKQDQHKNTSLLIQLRVVCVKFLCAALSTPEYNLPRQHNMRARILQCYFKLLYRPEKDIVDATYASLKGIVNQQGKLPKDMLQIGLRPVLQNLADWRKLDVPSLQGLARLLELLVNYFKVEIGVKLLDHFKALCSDVAVLTRAEVATQDEGNPLKVLSSIVNIFHLLPQPASSCYLVDLCSLVVDTERTLKKVGSTIFTQPLALYLNAYPQEAASLFLMRLVDDIAWCRTFIAILGSGHAPQLREYVQANASTVFTPLFGADQRPPPTEEEGVRMPWQAPYHGALVVLSLIRQDPVWMKDHNVLLGALVSRWVSADRQKRLGSQNHEHFKQIAEDEAVLEIFLVYLKLEDHVDMAFHAMDVLTVKQPTSQLVLLRHIYLKIVASTNLSFKKRMLDRFLDLHSNPDVSEAHKAAALKHLINPILLRHFSNQAEEGNMLDAEFIARLHAIIWQPLLEESWRKSKPTTEALHVELMYLTKLIIRYQPSLIVENRKEIIKFGWSHTTSNESTILYTAYSMIAQFLAKYESPTKIVLMIYGHLIKGHNVDTKTLVREGLAVLAPSLPIRGVYPSEPLDSWVKVTRALLSEESHISLGQITHIYQFIIRQPDLFFFKRETFIHHIITNLPRLATLQTASPETRVLAVDLFALLLTWERTRLRLAEERSKTSQAMDVDSDPSTRSSSVALSSVSAGAQGASWQFSPLMKDQVISLLIRSIFAMGDPQNRMQDHQKTLNEALTLLAAFLALPLWADVTIKANVFQQPLMRTEITEVNTPLLNAALRALAAVVATKSEEWTFNNLPQLSRLLERPLHSSDPRTLSLVQPILEKAFAVAKPVSIVAAEKAPTDENAPDEQPSPTIVADQTVDEGSRHLFEWAVNSVDEGLRAMLNLHSTLTIVCALSQARPDTVEYFAPTLVRVVNRLTKEHLSNSLPDNLLESHQKLLESTINVLKSRVGAIGDQRRWLLSALVQLVEKSNSVSMCRYLLDLLTHWVFDERKEIYPTIKEKAGLLAKMMTFEGRQDESLLKDFLRVVLRLYGDPSFARSEITVRLEQAFLLGCRNRDPSLRCDFLALFDRSISRSLFSRLHYLLGVQSWETLSETNWLHQAFDLLLGSADQDVLFFPNLSAADLQKPFVEAELANHKSGQLLEAVRKLCYADGAVTAILWPSAFAAGWNCLSRKEQSEVTRFTVSLLSKDYHLRCVDRRPNNVQILLLGLEACSDPQPVLPPHLLRYLGRTYNAWYTSLEMVQDAVERGEIDSTFFTNNTSDNPTNVIQETSLDALAELYSDLCEDDLFYGLWRRRSFYPETNIAISFEQNGMWSQAQYMYEAAQVKARTGAMPFTESEYAVWEDQWVTCAMKLQQWDVLAELARHEGNPDLSLESLWRTADWCNDRDSVSQAIDQIPPVSTPRRRVFEALMQLVKSSIPNGGQEATSRDAFVKICTSGIELALRKWFYLPEFVGQAHIPVLHTFQQFVELQEAGQVFAALSAINAQTVDGRMNEVKTTLLAWRERLPNEWDDINVWSDLIAWRQHVFQAINRALMPLLPPQNGSNQQANAGNSSSLAYRGYHETAWTINRFAHVARKHQLMDVCIGALNKIYTLPNIEIQEAFLKLREQAKSHFYAPGGGELTQGLDVINNTNLMYFNPTQKAEFFTLKGMFLSKLGVRDEASQVFNQAVSLDMHFPKAWAEWGDFHDRLFKENPGDLSLATNAVSCYLQAGGMFKNQKTRKLLIRILWLLSLDDAQGTVAKAFDAYKGDVPTWYWITFIPQLLQSLSHREAKYARLILLKIARHFPQSLFFQLRTAKIEMDVTKKQCYRSKAERAAKQREEGNSQEKDAAMEIDISDRRDNPWDLLDEVHSSLKTSYPLMSLTLESMADQLVQRFKPTYEEEMHRILYHLIHDALIIILSKTDRSDDDQVPDANVQHMKRFCENIANEPLKTQFAQDFVQERPNLAQFVARLQKWRNKFRHILDGRQKKQMLESCSHWLVEFLYHRFDEVEIPGQYIQLEDNAQNFVRIAYFDHRFDFQRYAASTVRRLTFVGQDGSRHPFVVQSPTPKHSRREERIQQLLRLLNCPLQRFKESRKRNLTFFTPTIVPLASSHRLVASDISVTSLLDVFDEHCTRNNMSPEDPVLAWAQSMRRLKALRAGQMSESDLEAARLEVYGEISTKLFPDDILKKFMARALNTSADLWHARKQMTLDLASFILSTFVFFMGGRGPLRLHISKSTGAFYTVDALPNFGQTMPEIRHSEPVPFRFTPNLQRFVTAIGTEGRLVTAILAMSRALLETENDLEHRLSIFIKEELHSWYGLHQQTPVEGALRDATLANVDTMVKRTKLLACMVEREKQPVGAVPANQTILELIAQATNPIRLSATDITQMPWL